MEVLRPQIVVVGGRQYRKNPIDPKYKVDECHETNSAPYTEQENEGGKRFLAFSLHVCLQMLFYSASVSPYVVVQYVRC